VMSYFVLPPLLTILREFECNVEQDDVECLSKQYGSRKVKSHV
jgi:hypothetical protein